MRLAETVFAACGTTVFETMSRLAEASQAINLGQGFPEEGWPPEILAEAARALTRDSQQYPPMRGLPALRQAVAAHEARFWGRDLDPATEIVVTVGATEALAASLFALIGPGDEVVVFEPLYDAYLPLIRQAGGVPVPVRLAAPDWRLDAAALAGAIGPRTRAMLLNDPLNPAAKVFTADELAGIADLALAHDLIVIADAVYEHIVFDGRRHLPISGLPGMAGRTLKIGSAGKIFSLTGWKIGWVTGPAVLVDRVARAHQFLTFTVPPNLQAAVAFGLGLDDSFFTGLAADLAAKRDRLAAGLGAAGLAVLPSHGTYFVNVSLAGTGWAGRDLAFCEWLTRDAKVAAIPLSAFYAREAPGDVVRFCFAKRDAVLDEASARLRLALG